MAKLSSALDRGLRGLGVISCAVAGVACYRYYAAMRSNCDYPCAVARLSPGAFAGKVAWVTGASSGIGKELAVQLARQGASLILSARRAEALELLAKELRAGGAKVHVLVLDLADLNSLPDKAKEALAAFGHIDMLVNNGGYSSRALARDTPGVKEEAAMMDVNFLSCIALAKAVAPSMRERKQGWIVNISSIAGKVGVPLRTMYCGAKHALIGWFDAFRAEEAGFYQSGIVVTNVCPGSTKTDVARNAVLADGQRMGNTDPNIEGGLEVEFVCDRILAAAHHGLHEVWIARPAELHAAYTASFYPARSKRTFIQNAHATVLRTMGQEFVDTRL